MRVLGLWLLLCCLVGAPARAQPAAAADPDRLLIVAVSDAPQPLPSVGSTPRADYRRLQGYAGSTRAQALAAELAHDHGLAQQDAWTILPLRLRCVLYRVAAGADRAAVLAALGRDPRVQLAQPLNTFETLQAGPEGSAYNDPYIGLQRGFAALNAAEAQRYSQGLGVRVAVIDSAIDTTHPDLEGRIASQRDFAGAAHPLAGGAERHGTAVAGVIAAGANNRIGIVGVAPQAQLLAYRACWAVAVPAGASRCDSFSLAQALGAAIAADADIINLSLGGPADPLLTRLAEHAMARGVIVIGALPPGGRRDGFPVGVPGVLAVGSSDDAPVPGAAGAGLSAPGRDILTLTPGGHYDFASGSSLATAHVSGAVALLRALQPGLRGVTAQAWLTPAAGSATQAADACAAVRRARPAARCEAAGRTAAP